ncbi:MAG: hypothetical protein JWN75_181 [Candidatus Saccharibacteria bacterium]|nr:hypothetical protein [Candidatus Saccharibacteria bacterium]
MKHLRKQTLTRVIIASITLAIIIVPTVAFARGGEQTEIESTSSSKGKVNVSTVVTDQKSRAEVEIRDKLETEKQEVQQKVAKLETEAKQKLDDTKRQICEKQQSGINTVMENMDARRQKAFDHITTVSEAVQAFYTKKGLSVENYDSLVAAVTTAKSAAQAAMVTQQSVPTFHCSGDHPRADISDFKEKRAASIDANGAYRDAVKYLIKAVKTAVKGTVS